MPPIPVTYTPRPFVRQAYDPRNDTIGKLLMLQGQQQADAVQRRGDISAQMWANLGQQISSIPNQMQAVKIQEEQSQARKQEAAIRQTELDKIAQQKADTAAVDSAFAADARPEGWQGPQQPGQEWPKLDRAGILNALPGHLRGAVQKQFQDADESAFKVKDLKAKAVDAERDYFGGLGMSIRANGYSDAAIQAALQHAVETDPDYADTAKSVWQQIQSNPDKKQQIIDGVIAQSPKHASTILAEKKQAEETRHNTAAEQAALAKPAPNPNEWSVYLDAAGGDPQKALALRNADDLKKAAAGKTPADPLVKVEHRDPDTGRTVIEWLPKSQLAGRTFQKGAGSATETRLASAEAVLQTGNEIIAKMSDPEVVKNLGPVAGRYTSIREFIGNPPPEFSELAGLIESYSLANMGVHGMRSSQGAQQIQKMLDQPLNPESLAAAVRGLSGFAQHFMDNEGRPVGGVAPKTQKTASPLTLDVGGKTYTFPNQAALDGFKKAAGIK